jgi:hypothetical protein
MQWTYYIGCPTAIYLKTNRMKENAKVMKNCFTFLSIMVVRKCIRIKNSVTHDISTCNKTAR